MPFTVITIKNVPQSLRGDLTKWMQEIATGVYVGNFNSKIRGNLWNRVKESVGNGEATISFSFRNEIGYSFETINAQREVLDVDGIPLVLLQKNNESGRELFKLGFSLAAKNRRIRKFATNCKKSNQKSYVVLDIETDGLDEYENSILEIGALKIKESDVQEYQYLIQSEKELPKNIVELTGITKDLLDKKGESLTFVLKELLNFIEDLDIVGYGVDFDIRFINTNLERLGLPLLKNKSYDLKKYVKSEKMFLNNYRLQTVLNAYGIDGQVPHRALLDVKLIFELITKVNKFSKIFFK